jgi:DNA-binding MarR family transcriptional regulator
LVNDPELTGTSAHGHHTGAQPAGRGPGADKAAALACEVSELLEVMWGRDREVPTAPLSASQLRVLFVLEQRHGVNMRTLADILGSTASSVSRLLDRLQAVGYVERTPSPASRRELELYLTWPGRKYLTALRAQRESEVAAVLSAMTPDARQSLREGLTAFRDAAAHHTYAARRDPAGEPKFDEDPRKAD